MASEGKAVGAMVESKEFYLSAYAVEGVPTSDHLKFRTVAVPVTADSIREGHVAVQILLMSVDPYLRTRLTGRNDGLYFPQFELNQVHLNKNLEPLWVPNCGLVFWVNSTCSEDAMFPSQCWRTCQMRA